MTNRELLTQYEFIESMLRNDSGDKVVEMTNQELCIQNEFIESMLESDSEDKTDEILKIVKKRMDKDKTAGI